jgi:hypothetical protein
MNADHGQIEKHIQEIVESVEESLDILSNFRRGTKDFARTMGCAIGLVEALNILGCRCQIDVDCDTKEYYLDIESDV